MTLGDKIKKARLDMGYTQKKLAELIEAKPTAISNWEKNINKPDIEMVQKLCSTLNVSALYFIPPKIEQQEFTLQEKGMVKKYRELDIHGKDIVDTVIEKEYERCIAVSEEEKPEIIQIKLSQLPASAGTGVDLYAENYEIMSVRASDLTKQADFAVKVSGDSMESTFFDGDILLIESMPFINKGDIGIFVVNGDGFVKEYGGDRLISHNEKYPDIKLTEHDVVICSGRVIGALEESDFID